MKTTITGNKLTIEIDLQPPAPSQSGKTLIVASTHGSIKTDAQVGGKPLTISLNAYIKP